MLFRIHKFREQITGKHRFYEPYRPPVGHLAEAQSRRETLNAELTSESDGSQVLPLRLRLQTKPDRLIEQRQQSGRLCHGRLFYIGNYRIATPSFEKSSKYFTIFLLATARAIIS